jgi:3-methyl-2-oxobutanoate hydroxymethyltransferase
MGNKKITILDIKGLKESKEPICMLTSYDFPLTKIIDEANVDIILVGDSLGNVILGYDNTLPVTMEEILHHIKAVNRGRKRALLVGDMPFMSYQISIEEAKKNAGRMIKAGADAVKLEGGELMSEVIKAITDIDIPVMGHIGLTPQSIHRMGGYKVQGRGGKERERLLKDAMAVEEAGAFSVVLEGIPMDLAKEITSQLKIPTIGIGAGPYCDGQVLVLHDILGLSGDFRPKFVKKYVDLREIISEAVKSYISEVKNGEFPREEHSFK